MVNVYFEFSFSEIRFDEIRPCPGLGKTNKSYVATSGNCPAGKCLHGTVRRGTIRRETGLEHLSTSFCRISIFEQ